MGFYGNIHEISMNDYFNSVKFKRAYTQGGENTFPDPSIILGSDLQLTATVPAQQIEFATGNKWIEFVVDNDSALMNNTQNVAYGVTLYHKKADGDVTDALIDFQDAVYKVDNEVIKDSNENPILNYGGLFKVNSFEFDEAGHASGTTESKQTYALPQVISGQHSSTQTKYDYAKKLYDDITQATGETKLNKEKELNTFLRNYPFSAEQILTPIANNTNSIATLNYVVNPHKDSYQSLDPNNYTLIENIQAGNGLQKDISILNNRTVNMHTDISNLNVTAGIATGTQKPGIHFVSVGDNTESYLEYISPTNFDITNPHYIRSGLHGEMFNQYKVDGISATNNKLLDGNNIVTGKYGHAEGYATRAIGNYSHAENGYESGGYPYSSIAYGESSHAEGRSHIRIQALPVASQSSTDGKNYTLTVNASELDTILDDTKDSVKIDNFLNNICVGIDVLKNGVYEHKIYPINFLNKGPGTVTFQITINDGETIGNNHNIELYTGIAYADYSHVEGRGCIARGTAAHAEGLRAAAIGSRSHAEGCVTTAIGPNTHAEGYFTKAKGSNSHAEGGSILNESNKTISTYLIAFGSASHAEGRGTWAGGAASHTEGYKTKTGVFNPNGDYTDDTGKYAHAEGEESVASGEGAHAEGKSTAAEGQFSHAEGEMTRAIGKGSHAEGGPSSARSVEAKGDYSHAEGIATLVEDSATAAHAEGHFTVASHNYSHVGGSHTKTSKDAQTVIGTYNDDESTASFIVGCGTSEDNRKNLFAITEEKKDDKIYTGLILLSPNGHRWKFTIDNDGNFTTPIDLDATS